MDNGAEGRNGGGLDNHSRNRRGIEDIWGISCGRRAGGPAHLRKNVIVNLEQTSDAGLDLKMTAHADGHFEVTNPREADQEVLRTIRIGSRGLGFSTAVDCCRERRSHVCVRERPEIRTVESGAPQTSSLNDRRTSRRPLPVSPDQHRQVRVHVKEVSLFRITHDLPDSTRSTARAFRCSRRPAGTLGKPVDLAYDELEHYKIPQPADAKVVTGMMTLTPPGGDTMLLGLHQLPPIQRALFPASEIHRSGARYRRPGADAGRKLGPRRVPVHHGPNRAALLTRLAVRIDRQPSAAAILRRPPGRAGAVGIASGRASPRRT